jgi:hypothetical protein
MWLHRHGMWNLQFNLPKAWKPLGNLLEQAFFLLLLAIVEHCLLISFQEAANIVLVLFTFLYFRVQVDQVLKLFLRQVNQMLFVVLAVNQYTHAGLQFINCLDDSCEVHIILDSLVSDVIHFQIVL